MGEEASRDEVSVIVDGGLSQDKTDQDDQKDGVTDVDNINASGDDKTDAKTKAAPKEKDAEKPADKGETKVATDEVKTLTQRLDRLETDKKNLQIALHKERQAKKGTQKAEETVLTDEQLERIIEENPGDPKIQLRVTRYMAEKIAKGMKDTAMSEVDVSQKSKAMNNLLLERYPQLSDESSDMRVEIDQVKESLGLANHPFGDAFAVGFRVFESLPTLLTNAYERGKKESLGTAAEKKRGDKIKDSELTPKGKGKPSADAEELSKEHADTAKQMNMTPSQMKIYKQLVGKQPRTLSVEE
jgi:hypothetical protein